MLHYVGKVLSIEDETRIKIGFLRMKSVVMKDTFYFPAIANVEEVEKDRVLGVPLGYEGDHTEAVGPHQDRPSSYQLQYAVALSLDE